YEGLVNDTISIEFSGTDFESNYVKLMPHFEQKRMDLEAELAGLKQKLSDRNASERARLLNLPPGMVLVPGGKYRIGMDAKEFEQLRTMLGYGAGAGYIDIYSMGWPPFDVELTDFYIDVNEVTCSYWAEFIKDTGRKAPKNWTIEKKGPDSRKAGVPDS